MAKNKNHYYILVFTNGGPVYVTNILPDKVAEWKNTDTPMEFTKERAEDICVGLNLNLSLAQVVVSKWKLETQPYRYDEFELEFKEKENR